EDGPPGGLVALADGAPEELEAEVVARGLAAQVLARLLVAGAGELCHRHPPHAQPFGPAPRARGHRRHDDRNATRHPGRYFAGSHAPRLLPWQVAPLVAGDCRRCAALPCLAPALPTL